MRLLVVEDDPTISHFLVKGLEEDQHLVDLAEDGPAAETRALEGDYDAILLDVMLPETDGMEVCRRLRTQGVGTIVSRDQLAEHVWGGDYEPESNVADVYVGYLRRKLAGTRSADAIRTIRGLGYMLARSDA